MRLSMVIAVTCGMILGSSIVNSPIFARDLVIPAYPADAVIRGENIRLRVDATADSADIAILQRGDEIVVTAESTRANGEEFFPVEVVLTGATGWVRALAVDPRSIAASTTATAPEVVETVAVVEPVDPATVDQAAEREARRAARQANTEPTPATEPAPADAAPAADGADPAADRVARRAAREADAQNNAGADEANAQSKKLRFNGSEPTVTDSFTVPSGVMTVTASHEGDGNFSVLAYSPDGYEELLFNEIGPFNGQSALEVDPESTLILDVTANGPWEVVIEPSF